MARPRLYTIYALTVAGLGLGLAVLTTVLEVPHDVHSWTDDVVSRALILLVLTFLSSLSPMKTRYGASLTVGLAPLFGALLILPPWAVMWVAALGTMDERVPGKQIAWKRFLFSRGMFALVYGIPSLALAVLGLAPVNGTPPFLWYIVQPLIVVVVVAVNFSLVSLFFSLLEGSSWWALVRKEVAEIVMHHHERWDGKGYPRGLRGEEIPLGSRIVNACDAFDTITQARVFRPTVKTPAEAIRELRQLAGTWYDPAVISALEKIVEARWGVELQHQPEAASAPSYRQVLRIGSFRRLWLGQGVSYFGDMMNTTGLAIMLYLVTRSASLVALGLIAKAVPTILFGLIAGPVVDRFNRQRLMVGLDLARAVMTITIPFFALRWLPGVFIAVFLFAAASAFFNPAKQAIVPNLVPPRLLIKANSLV